jgi:hypothetical protein
MREGDVGMMVGVMVVVVIIGLLLIPLIFFLLMLQKTLQRCAPENREMEPTHVWLSLIPVFNLYWQFVIVMRVAGSLAKEFASRGIAVEPEPGKFLGLMTCILALCGWIPVLGIITSLEGLVSWVMYWVKIAGYSKQIAGPWQSTPFAGTAT